MRRRTIPRYLCVPDLKTNASPKWIPLPLQLLDDYRLKGLRDVDCWHYVGICLLAARCGNRLRGDAKWIGERIRTDEPIDLLRLIEAELIVSAGKSKSKCVSEPADSVPNQKRVRSRHDLETLRRYAASKPNARSVKELSGYFARTGAADDEIDAWLAQQSALQTAQQQQQQREADDELRQHAEFVAEIAARGGPRDEVERMIWEARPTD